MRAGLAIEPVRFRQRQPTGDNVHLVSQSPYANVFFYFGGLSAADHDEPDGARQIEDNTTKALITLLQHSEPAVATSWLAALGIARDCDGGAFEFFVQGGPKVCAAPSRRLVVITDGDDAASATWADGSARCRVL